MTETIAKNHHLVPKTYMTAWANSSGTLCIEFLKKPGQIENRNKENIAGITDFHTIRAGMSCCTEADAEQIFKAVEGYSVVCDGVELRTPLELNKNYWHFDEWIIKRTDGSLVSKKAIRHEIEQVKIKDIEAKWSEKNENQWNAEVSRIEAMISTGKPYTHSFDKEYLMCFFTALDWRGFSSNAEFEDLYRQITHGVLDTVIAGPEMFAALKKELEKTTPVVAKTVEIVGGNCYVRDGASTEGKKLGVAHRGETWLYAGETAENGWNRIDWNGKPGWVSGKYSRLVEGGK